MQQALSNCAANRSGNQGHEALQARLLTLTPRERDILLPLVQGYTTREIAEQLGVSVKTVDLYRARVMKRMQANTLPDLVGMAIAAQMVDPLKLR
ncbi:Transcriptional regulatory protein FixJ [compost metagenome]